MRLTLKPLTLREANGFVAARHRHSDPTVGCKFAVGAARAGQLVGVAVCGRPVARHLDDGFTLEVLRLCTDGTKNACSFLYSACRRAGVAMGYTRFVTYTLTTEPGTSLVAAGWHPAERVRGKSWDCPSRPRAGGSRADRFRWECKA